jgi:hypothetical protein
MCDKNEVRAVPFYLLPKVHKKGVPGRPVVSGCGTPTEKLSHWVDYHINPLVEKHVDSYIKDTSDFLRALPDIKVDDKSILFTVDVVALYPSIPVKDGIKSVREFLQVHPCSIDSDVICKAIDLVLRNNVCTFDNMYYLQKSGTAIGTKLAPSFANIFMHMLERRMIDSSQYKPLIYRRFIDDGFGIWQYGLDKLKDFIADLNAVHPHINFTFEYSDVECNFLDVRVYKVGDHLETDVYTKPTDTHQFLHYQSCHSRHCKSSLPYSQALRLRRICSEDYILRKRCDELQNYFVDRGYKLSLVKEQIAKACNISRTEALKPKGQQVSTVPKFDRTRMVVTYSPAVSRIGKILYRNFNVIQSSEKLRTCIKPPMVAYRKPKSLRDLLVHSKFQSKRVTNGGGCTEKCGNKRCKICPSINSDSSFTSTKTGHSYAIYGKSDCNAKNVIYMITCQRCKLQYVGSTNNFRLRMNNHKSRIRTHDPSTYDEFVYQHFYEHGLDNFSVQIIDNYNNSGLEREGFWIYKLQTIKPNGLNSDDLFGAAQHRSRNKNK